MAGLTHLDCHYWHYDHEHRVQSLGYDGNNSRFANAMPNDIPWAMWRDYVASPKIAGPDEPGVLVLGGVHQRSGMRCAGHSTSCRDTCFGKPCKLSSQRLGRSRLRVHNTTPLFEVSYRIIGQSSND